MKAFTKKLAFYLAAFMLIFSAVSILTPGEVNAASAKAKLSYKKASTSVEYKNSTFTIENADLNAVYTVTPKKDDIANVSNMTFYRKYDEKIDSYLNTGYMSVNLNVFKKGKAIFTVKETKNGKTTKVGKFTLNVKAAEKNTDPSYVWPSYNYIDDTGISYISVPANTDFNLFSSGILYTYSASSKLNDVYMISSDSDVLTVDNNGNVNTLKAGNATITVDYSSWEYDYDYNIGQYQDATISIDVTVTDSTLSNKNKYYNNSVQKLLDTKITANNLTTYYNDFVELSNMDKSNFFMQNDLGPIRQRLAEYLDANSTLSVSAYSTTPEGLTITKVSKSEGISFTLDNPITTTDMVALLLNTWTDSGIKKYTKTSKANMSINLTTETGYTVYIPAEVKEGTTKGVAKDIYGVLEYVDKGEKLHFTNFNKKNGKMDVGVITVQN